MHGTIRTRTAHEPAPVERHNAAVWIEPGRALVVRDLGGGGTDTLEVGIPLQPASVPPALAAVAHHVGKAARVLVIGPADLRTALEREIVAIGHRPDAIREGAAEGPVDRDGLLAKLRRLA
jgi:hypothetical protein